MSENPRSIFFCLHLTKSHSFINVFYILCCSKDSFLWIQYFSHLFLAFFSCMNLRCYLFQIHNSLFYLISVFCYRKPTFYFGLVWSVCRNIKLFFFRFELFVHEIVITPDLNFLLFDFIEIFSVDKVSARVPYWKFFELGFPPRYST